MSLVKNTIRRQFPKEYGSWAAMRQRCLDRRKDNFAYYGGIGITFDDRWNVFSNFIEDMGPKPHPDLELDRIDPSKGYSKSNCRWASRTEQNNNTRANYFVDAFGMRLTIAELSRHPKCVVKRVTLSWRIHRGDDPEIAAITPVRKKA